MTHEINIVALNVNDDRRVYAGTPLAPGFVDLSFDNRFGLTSALLDSLNETNQTIYALQEANDPARERLKAFFEEKGLTVLTSKYANDPGAFNFVFAFNSTLYELKETFQFYYTDNGLSTDPEERAALTKEEKIKKHLGTEFEKSVQFVRLRDKRNDKEFLVANTHPGLEMPHRLAAMTKLSEFLRNETGMVIAVGDFNQFDATKINPTVYQDQVKVLTDNGFQWASEGLTRIGMKTTFMGFPYDILRFFNANDHAEYKALLEDRNNYPALRQFFISKIKEKNISLYGGCLDAVFTRGLPDSARVKVSSFTMFKRERVETSSYDNPEQFQEGFVKHFIDNPASDSVEPPTNSDHFALRTVISM